MIENLKRVVRYSKWLAENADKKGTPDYQKVFAAFQRIAPTQSDDGTVVHFAILIVGGIVGTGLIRRLFLWAFATTIRAPLLRAAAANLTALPVTIAFVAIADGGPYMWQRAFILAAPQALWLAFDIIRIVVGMEGVERAGAVKRAIEVHHKAGRYIATIPSILIFFFLWTGPVMKHASEWGVILGWLPAGVATMVIWLSIQRIWLLMLFVSLIAIGVFFQ